MRTYELRQALVAALKNDAANAALLSTDPQDGTPAVYDHVPQNATFPYQSIGPIVGDEEDTDDALGAWSLEVQVDTWSRFRGMDEVERIHRTTDDALHRADLTVTDAKVVTIHREDVDAVLDDDGLTRHGILRFRVILEEV